MGQEKIYFTAEWCGPCKVTRPIVEKIKAEYGIMIVDVDKNPTKASQYGIRSVPTFINGDNRKSGAMGEPQLREFFS